MCAVFSDPLTPTSNGPRFKRRAQFVINVDELLYEALAPLRVRKFLARIKPFRLPSARTWRGMDTKNVLNLTFTMTLLAFVGVHYLQPQIAMLQVRPASCQFRLLWCGRDPQ